MRKAEEVEEEVFLTALRLRHGYDFCSYARPSLRRRLHLLALREGVAGVADLVPGILRDDTLLSRVLSALVVPVTEGFRDPAFFLALRRLVLPVLKSYAEPTIWLAGCASGEEAYSVAILLDEAGLLERSHVFGTDIDPQGLAVATAGRLTSAAAEAFAAAYGQAGGTGRFAEYTEADGHGWRFAERLRRRISFVHHNLAADGVFCEAHLVLCRNVLIYFNRELQDQCLRLFFGSLARGGFLGLGLKEDLRFSPLAECFEAIDGDLRLYRRRPLPRVPQ